MARRTLSKIRAIVTGASSGIGREIALQLASHNARLVLTARRRSRLDEIAARIGTSVSAPPILVEGDITDSAIQRELIDMVEKNWSALDLLINNAGIGGIGPFAGSDSQRMRRIMEVNLIAPLELIRLSLPLLQRGRRPMIVNIGSVLGHFAVPHKSEYCASKFALRGFSDSLRMELAESGVDVLLVSPSTTRSEFFEHVIGEGKMAKPVTEKTQSQNAIAGGMDPAVVARKTLRAIARGKHEIVLSAGGKALVWLNRVCPRFSHWLLHRFSPR